MKKVTLVCAGHAEMDVDECVFRTTSLDALREHTRKEHGREARFPNLVDPQ